MLLTGWGWLLYDEIHPFKSPASLTWIQWLGNLTLTEIWRPNVIGADGTRFFLGVAWTLCYEEQFYLVCGLLMCLGPRHFFRNCLGVTALIVLSILYIMATTGVGDRSGFFFDGRWLEFACGIGLYYRIHHTPANLPVWRRHLMEGSLFLVFAFSLASWLILKNSFLEELFVSSLFAMELVPLFRFDRIWLSAKAWRGIWMCGTMCYSFYLLHSITVKALSNVFFRLGIEGLWMTTLVTIPFCILFAVALSWPFHCLVERRYLNTKPVDLDELSSRKPAAVTADYPLPAVPSE